MFEFPVLDEATLDDLREIEGGWPANSTVEDGAGAIG